MSYMGSSTECTNRWRKETEWPGGGHSRTSEHNAKERWPKAVVLT